MQEPARFCSLHSAFVPQGEGEQGDTLSGSISARKMSVVIFCQEKEEKTNLQGLGIH